MSTTRFPNGITNTKTGVSRNLTIIDETLVHKYLNDFDNYVAANWTVTETGTGTRALTDADGGVLLITNDSNNDDANFFNKVGESFLFESGKKLWFKTRFKVSDATESDVVVGLQITDITPLAVSDGVYFIKADGSTSVSFVVTKNTTPTTNANAATLVDDTYIELGFYYNGKDAIEYFADGSKVGTSAVTNLPDDEIMTISFGIQNGEAVAKTMSMDYIQVVKER